MIVRALSTGSVAGCNRQSSESEVVHDHIRPRQHKISTLACGVVHIGAGHVEHAGATQGGETAGCPSRSRELGSCRGSAEVIGDGCSDADRKVLLQRVGENSLPAA
jgi:hypothetical protein